MAPDIAPAVFLNHGGGPLPILEDQRQIGFTIFLRDKLKKHVNVKELKAIILVTAHWEESEVAISSGDKHELYFDYSNFPPETYKYKYPAPGDPALAKRVQDALVKDGIRAKLDPERGWDHGVFVPMMLINPDADVPIVQVSVLSSQDPEEHYRLGQVLAPFRREGIAIFGSGMSYHNMKEFVLARTKMGDGIVNVDFDNFLADTCTAEPSKTREGLLKWRQQPGASEAHPPGAAEHLMPLVVVAGAGGAARGERIFNWDMSNKFRLAGFIWRGL